MTRCGRIKASTEVRNADIKVTTVVFKSRNHGCKSGVYATLTSASRSEVSYPIGSNYELSKNNTSKVNTVYPKAWAKVPHCLA